MTDRLLRLAAVAYGAAVVVHVADHVRRGLDASPAVVLMLGGVAFALQAWAVGLVLTGRPNAARVAFAVALPNALGVVAVHLLPRWSGLSEPLAGAGAAPGATAWSVATAVAEVATGLLFAYVARPGAHVGSRASVG